jgi:hypothetical protein
MKHSFCLVLILGIISSGCKQPVNFSQTINPVIGDISFIEKFGALPDKFTDENLRIKTHLEFVEKLLRNNYADNLSADLKSKRNFLLDKLHEYWMSGSFPKNYDYSNERKPCFIDREGTICAVGYLVEQTSGRMLAEAVNQKYKYDKIFDMHAPEVIEWIKNSGLTLHECAMIQPTYGGNPTPYPYPVPSSNSANSISAGYGIGGSILDGINVSLSAVNLIHIFKGTDNKVVPALGLLSGAGSVALGIANLNDDESYDYWGNPTQNLYKKTFSFINIGIGTATMALSATNLLMNKPKKDKKLSWNVYGLPGENSSCGIQVVKRF